MRICLVGAGRVATQLGPALLRAGHIVSAVWSRTAASATVLAEQLSGAHSTTTTDLRQLEVEVVLLAVPDAAVEPLLAQLQLPAHALVAHTAGALPLAVFAPYPHLRGGVFYPLQTFSPGRMVEWVTLPLCIEAADDASQATLLALAHTLSQDVRLLSTEQRLLLHTAAVFAGNFTNHVLGISHALLQEAGLPFELVAPLVRETVEKALAYPPFTVQTGPAARHDAPTLARHQAALHAHPTWQEVYAAVSRSIQEQQAGRQPAGFDSGGGIRTFAPLC
ncbi:DUF2520 domain-containing protein [Hymenobacter aerilatus]|uniref:DUF2520 domain-containing protein n=1 Tax=Hymenobacter aerilatus TaxID=2932251 RepID=A0A8T9SWT7_9BACT|nr:Rossmann-like and DUF2520 domain-containing protein [Hymenobacter aerilatus]UOR04256.1 DUF2520 domain-containing protein [Hymenobacter aerilatus]